MEQTDVIYGVTAVLLLSGFLGSWTGAGIAENKKMLASLLAGTCYYLTLLCITAVIFEGRYQNIWITAALILGSSCGAGFVRMRKRKSGYTSKIRRVKI